VDYPNRESPVTATCSELALALGRRTPKYTHFQYKAVRLALATVSLWSGTPIAIEQDAGKNRKEGGTIMKVKSSLKAGMARR